MLELVSLQTYVVSWRLRVSGLCPPLDLCMTWLRSLPQINLLQERAVEGSLRQPMWKCTGMVKPATLTQWLMRCLSVSGVCRR